MHCDDVEPGASANGADRLLRGGSAGACGGGEDETKKSDLLIGAPERDESVDGPGGDRVGLP